MTALTDTFGPCVDVAQVEDAVSALILRWIDDYLLRVERANGLPDRTYLEHGQRIVSDRVADEVDTLPEDAFPALVVASGGEVDDPQEDDEGELSSMLSMVALVYVRAGGRDDTRVAARHYGWAVATLLDHKFGSLDGLAQLASRPRQVYDDRRRAATSDYIGLAAVSFAVLTGPVRSRRGGPATPSPGPGSDPPVYTVTPVAETIGVDAVHLDE